MSEVDWRANLIEDEARIAEIVRGLRRVAVLGIKTAERASEAAYFVPEYLQSAGVEIVPVPVYYPDATEILGAKVVRRVADAGPVDLVDVFRRPRDVAGHVDDLIAARPKVVWLQLGIRDDASAERLARAGIQVVQDRCLLVDHRRFART
jgi:hypothetical protein